METPIEMTPEKFAEIYTNEKFRNAVARAYKCYDQYHHFLYRFVLNKFNKYIVTDEQITEAKMELQRAKAEVYRKHGNDLLFVCMGCDYKPRYEGDPCNYRILTEFTNRFGHRFLIEFSRAPTDEGFFIIFAIDRDREFELKSDPERQQEYCNYKGLETTTFNQAYTKDNILKLVNEQFDCLFRKVIIDQHTISMDDREIICESPKE